MNGYKIVLQRRTYSEPIQTSKIELFVKIIEGFHLLTIFGKTSILDFDWVECASVLKLKNNIIIIIIIRIIQ